MDKRLQLANRLYEVIIGNLSCINAWGFYLFAPEFRGEPELRHKIGVIWFGALMDSVEADNRFIPEVIEEARNSGYDSLVHNGQQLQKLCKLSAELIEEFSREEQIFLLDLRNQWTHGYLANRHRDSVRVKYVAKAKLVLENLSHYEYRSLLEPLFARDSIDVTLQPMINRALNQKHGYWKAVGVLQKCERKMYRILRDGEVFNVSV